MNDVELPKDYSGEDITTDYTDALKKIWDSKIPKSSKSIISFDTIKAIFNEHKKYTGPYHLWEDKLFFRANAKLPIGPLKKIGFSENTEITVETFKNAYGDIDQEIREKMIILSRYVGLNLSQFDLKGQITYYFE